MSQVNQLEKQLDEIFVKNAPFQLPKNVKDWIVQYLPYINLFFGIVSLWAAWGVYNAARLANNLADYANELNRAFGTNNYVSTSRLTMVVWLAVAALVAQGVIWIAAYPGTKARQKSGWNLLFLAVGLNAIYGLVSLFTYYGGIGNFLGYLIGTAVGLYFLFQIRSYYIDKSLETASKSSKPSSAASKTAKK